MGEKEKIEATRIILTEAIKQNKDKKTILNISEELDQYIVDYYLKQNQDERK
ncbi:MAG TPA: Spo0E family sporulation regulatory protein-aspartic acid phosphatase [Syntrophomonadaceae bacterium]|nr:Spo0E family sporulation regulatory protein-aspartic acid phosphatase [Syntrophomonadaceae bacterium]